MDDPFVVLYRWRIREGFEDRFIEGWTSVTDYFVEHCGSLGSRLHKGDDGIWYAYAVWRSEEDRQSAFLPDDLVSSRKAMSESILGRLPEVVLEVVVDGWK